MLFRAGFVGRQVVGGSGASGPPGATLALNFMQPGVLDPTITFTRASTGTYFDSTGTMQTAGLNVAISSSDYTGATYNKSGVTVALNGPTSPDGVSLMTTVTEGVSASNHSFYNTNNLSVTAATWTYSVFVRPGTQRYISLRGNAADAVPNLPWITFDTQARTINANASVTASGFIALPDGTFRIWMTAPSTATATGAAVVAGSNIATAPVQSSSLGNSYTGTSQTWYAWGLQVELGSVATQYAPTTTVANSSPRWDYDPVTLQLRGLLLEDARTNGVRNSSDMSAVVPGTPGTAPTNWSYNGAGPGLLTDTVGSGVESGIPYVDIRYYGTTSVAGGNVLIAEGGTGIVAATGQAWTGSIYWRVVSGTTNGITSSQIFIRELTSAGAVIKDNTPVTVANPTTSSLASQRIVGGATLSGGGTTARVQARYVNNFSSGAVVDVTIRYGAPQTEQGDFATSFIPTTAAAVTRSIDSCLIPPANMSPWFASPGGSWFAEFDYFDSTPVNSRIISRVGAGGVSSLFLNTSNGVAQYDAVGLATVNAVSANTISKACSTWAVGEAKICANGGAIAKSATLVTGYGAFATTGVPFLTPAGPGNTDNTSGHIRRVTYWPRALSDAEMQQVTT